VQELGAGARACVCDVFWARDIHRIRRRLVAFGTVDVRVRGAIDHHIAAFDDRRCRGRIGDVPLRRGQRQQFAALISGQRR